MKRFALATLLVTGLVSNSLQAEDLIDVFNMALKSDPALLAEAASLRATEELDDQALANFLPKIDLGASTGKEWLDRSSENFGGDAEYNTHRYGLSLVQPLYRQQNYIVSKQADIAIEGAIASYKAVEQDLIVRVAQRYFEVLGREDDLTFADAEREAIAKQLEQTQQRFDVGMATITDVTESQAAYDIANASVIEAENALANSRESLREVAGKYLTELEALKTDSPLMMPDPVDSQQWTETALKQNPNLLVATTNVSNAKENIRLQKSGHSPSLDLVAQKNYSSQSDSIGVASGYSKTHQDEISLQFNLPIYQGGSVSSKTRQAEHQLSQAMQNEEAQRRSVTRLTRESYNGVISGVSRVKALKQAVISSEKALESTEAGYEVGTRTTVDVLNVRRNLFSARRDYSRARYTYIVNTLRLKQAAGIVSIEDVQQINTWLGAS